jgi:AcrR family transcriptional regulator
LTIVVQSNNIGRMRKRSTAADRTPRARAARAPAPERILSAALVAFAERGFDGATTREIAADAGVPQGLVTYHYASKQALWEAAVDWVFGELRRELAAADEALRDVSPIERWRAVMKRYVRFAARRPELHRLMTHEGAHDGPRLRWLVERHVTPLYERSVEAIRAAAPGLDAAHLHYVLIGAAAHPFAVAPEVERVTGRDPRTPQRVEAHAAAIVDWLVDGALAQAASTATRAPTKQSRNNR